MNNVNVFEEAFPFDRGDLSLPKHQWQTIERCLELRFELWRWRPSVDNGDGFTAQRQRQRRVTSDKTETTKYQVMRHTCTAPAKVSTAT